MPVFNYVALKNGERISGRVEATSLRAARESLRDMELTPLQVKEENYVPVAETTKKEVLTGKPRKLSTKEKIEFTNTLYILSKTGISVIEALYFIEANNPNRNLKLIASELRKQVLGGASLSEAISRNPKTFDHVYTALIRTGEESGELDDTLKRMMDLLEKQDELANEVRAAMTYPVVVVFIAIAVILIMLVFVFPAFKDMYAGMGQELPWITQFLMDSGMFLKANWWVIPIMLGGMVYGVKFLFTWPVSKRVLDTIGLNTPVLHKFIKFASISNFIAVLRVAFDAGVPILNGLVLANMTIDNLVIKDAIKMASLGVQQGQSLSNALKGSDAIPPIIMCMISTGEQAGQLADMLTLASEYIDTELDRTVKALNKLIEPVLLVVIGGIVLVLALALYLPLFQSYQHI